MVSILDRTLIIDLCIRFIHNYYWFKRGAEPCCPFHDVKAFALPQLVETSNVESPTPMHVYITPLPIASPQGCYEGCI